MSSFCLFSSSGFASRGEGVLTGCLPSDGSHPQALLPGWEVVLTTCFPSARSHPQALLPQFAAHDHLQGLH